MRLTRVLMLNMAGKDVEYLQTRLKDLKFYSEKIDGHFGQNTHMAVFNFQRSVGIKSDGVVGMQTWSHIDNTSIPIDTKIEEKKPIINPISNDIPFKPSFIGENGFMIYDCLLSDEEYIKKEVRKETIYLHHTAGGSRPDWTIGGWEKDFVKDKKGNPILDNNGNIIPLKVATQYIIGRKSSSNGDTSWDGKILRTFDDKYWAYHLGLNDIKNDELNSKSIAIEICNYGPLTLGSDGKFYNYVNKPIMKSEVVELNNEFRQYKYWEKYTDVQLESTRKLILYLSSKWGIEIEKGIYNEQWFDYNKSWFTNGGIRTHTQVRLDKYDLFPQLEMIQMLNSL